MNNFNDTKNLILDWGHEKGILSEGTKEKQSLKVLEEAGELVLAVGQNNLDDIKDGIGDVLVTLILLSNMCGVTVEDCLTIAYDEIKCRQGKMVNGTFKKFEIGED